MSIYKYYTDEDIEETAFGIGKVAHSFAAAKISHIRTVGSTTRSLEAVRSGAEVN